MTPLEEFVQKHRNRANVGNTDQNKGECVGLVMVYIKDVLKLSHIWGHAKDIYNNASLFEWEKIKNEASAYPQAGDIICWDGTQGGGYGHIAIVTTSSPKADTFTVFEQNSPVGSTPHITVYKKWYGVIGWLRPRDLNNCDKELKELNKQLDEMRDSRNRCKNNLEDLEKKYVSELDKKKEHIQSLLTDNAKLNDHLSKQTMTISSLIASEKLSKEEAEKCKDIAGQLQVALENAKARESISGYSVSELISELFKRIRGVSE